MEDDDKPFHCTAPNCGLRFANNDHLAVHQQKHQLTLKLGLRSVDSLVDQTPTPTRFLQTANEAELFEGIDNPFDQDFKKAAAKLNSQASVSSASVVASSSEQSLVTTKPSAATQYSEVIKVVPQVSVQAPSPPVSKSEIETPSIRIIIASSGSSTHSTVRTNSKQPTIRAIAGTPAPVIISALSGSTIPASIAAIIANPSSNVPLAKMPVVGVKTQSPASSALSAVPHPAIVTSSRALQNGTRVTSMAIAKQKRQVYSSKIAHTSTESEIRTLLDIDPKCVSSKHIQDKVFNDFYTSAFQKLKEVLQMSASTSSHPSTSSSQSSSQNGVITQTNQFNDFSDINGVMMSSPSSAGSRSPGSPGETDDPSRIPAKRSRRSQEDVDPDERRKRFLERNRAAASRCRQKRKIWVQQLEKKADDLSVTNSQLQNEIAVLRTEVAQLKALLLAHKDCPVTMQQQKAFIDQVNQVNSVAFTTVPETHTITLHAVTEPQTQTTTSTAEEVATSALTDMANRVTMEMEGRVSNANINDVTGSGIISTVVISQ